MRPGHVARYGAIAILIALWAFPLAWMVVASLTPEARLFGGAAVGPASAAGAAGTGAAGGAGVVWTPDLAHYRALFTERQFWLPVRNSLVVAGATTLFAVLVGTPCAYALARLRFRGRGLVGAAILAVSMFPQIAVVSPLFLMLRGVGLIDTYPGLVLPYLTFAMPLTVWLLAGFFRDLPSDLEDAARLDGAGRIRAAVQVMLPLAAPAIATTAILTFLYAWNEFLFALSFTLGPDRQTVPVAIALFRGQYQVPWGQVLAAAVVASVPVTVVVLAFQRRIVRGLTSGAVKG
ncbi:MAG: carbohydrate ABC transporter permease [Vicinamibacterales bacterium]